MIARRDASPPRSGAAGSDRLRLLVATAAAAAPARRRLAARALPEQPQRGRHAPPVLPVLRGEPVALLTFRRGRITSRHTGDSAGSQARVLDTWAARRAISSGTVFADATQPIGAAANFPSTIGARILDTLQKERFTGRYTGLDNTS